MSGLGGQGVVTAAHIIGVAAVKDGHFVLVNPFFGAEKRLAPTESYVRISSERIYDRGEVNYPNSIMVFHPDVIRLGKSYTMPFYSGIKKDGVVIVNSDEPMALSDEDLQRFKDLNVRLYFAPATKIAQEVSGTALATNIIMAGLFAGITKEVTVKSLRESIEDRFGARKFVASATTAALDEAIKKKYAKMEQLIQSNFKAVDEAIQFSETAQSVT